MNSIGTGGDSSTQASKARSASSLWFCPASMRDAFAEGAVADLVVGLQRIDEGQRRQAGEGVPCGAPSRKADASPW